MVEADDLPGPRAEFRDPAVTVRFMLAGNAHVTFQSGRTGARFTYRVEAARKRPGQNGGPSHFVSLLTGPDNSHSYQYLGSVYWNKEYVQTRGSKIARDATGAKAFSWVWRTLTAGKMHPELGVWHEGRCGRCGRRLTTPESIASGLGPVCAGRAMQ